MRTNIQKTSHKTLRTFEYSFEKQRIWPPFHKKIQKIQKVVNEFLNPTPARQNIAVNRPLSYTIYYEEMGFTNINRGYIANLRILPVQGGRGRPRGRPRGGKPGKYGEHGKR